MKKLTNRLGLPDALVRAIKNDSYNRGDSDYSATGLIKPARMAALENKHADENEEDASERIWSLLGQSVHTIIERAGGDDLKEKRLYATYNGIRISAQIDNLSLGDGVLSDYKVTTSFSFKTNEAPKADYVSQLNIQAELLRENGYDVKALQIIGLLRDWSKMQARNRDDYPQFQVIVQPIPLWPRTQTVAYINMRIAAHQLAKDVLPECDATEMWEKEPKWALMREGRKTAIKLFSNRDAAEGMANQELGLYVEYRPGDRIRCGAYCSVSQFCSQYREYRNGK
jgi:hypothetical protein